MAANAAEYSRSIEQEKVFADVQRWLMGETVNGVTPTQYNPFMQSVFQALGLQPIAIGTSTSGHTYSFGSGVE
jgi:hypothetical protein